MFAKLIAGMSSGYLLYLLSTQIVFLTVPHLKELSGLPLDEEDSEDELNGVPSSSRSKSISRIQSDTALSEGQGQSKKAPWRTFVAAVPRIIDSILGGDEPDVGEETGRRREPVDMNVPNPSSPRPTNAWSENDDALHGDLNPTVPPGPIPLPVQSSTQVLTTEPSLLLTVDDISALAAYVPARFQQARWTLLYSTIRDGISLQTLFRYAKGKSPTVLVVRDMHKALFGAYCSEPWRQAAHRYYGTGETFVFKLSPGNRVAWPWWWKRMSVERNDYFMLAEADGLAVGGAGGYAIWLDNDLAEGISRSSGTFGSPCLASEEEFTIGSVELWHLQ